MESKPRLPEEGINVSARNPVKEALKLTATLAVALFILFLVAGVLVDNAVGWIPPEKEKQFFEGLGEILETDESPRAEEILGKLQPIFDGILAQWPDAPYSFELGVIESEHPNALAMPGGKILVTTALMDMTDSENEVALVLGHELGHFKNRDHLRRLGRLIVINILVGTVLGSQAGANGEELMGLLSKLKEGSFSRGQELAADRFGLELVHKRFGHVAGSWQFFKKIGELPETPSKLGSYFATHPHPANRIEKIKSLAQEQGWPTTGALTPLSKE